MDKALMNGIVLIIVALCAGLALMFVMYKSEQAERRRSDKHRRLLSRRLYQQQVINTANEWYDVFSTIYK